MRLNCKADNILALQEGWFGNAPRQWQTMDEVTRAGADESVVVRPRVAGGRCWYEVNLAEWFLDCSWYDWFDHRDYYFNEPIQPKTVTLNAEITRSHGELMMFYSQFPGHMRPALRHFGSHACGLEALMIMRHCACDRGRQVIEDLMNEYPDHVIEFTCMTKPYGTLGWKTVVWEVRNY